MIQPCILTRLQNLRLSVTASLDCKLLLRAMSYQELRIRVLKLHNDSDEFADLVALPRTTETLFIYNPWAFYGLFLKSTDILHQATKLREFKFAHLSFNRTSTKLVLSSRERLTPLRIILTPVNFMYGKLFRELRNGGFITCNASSGTRGIQLLF